MALRSAHVLVVMSAFGPEVPHRVERRLADEGILRLEERREVVAPEFRGGLRTITDQDGRSTRIRGPQAPEEAPGELLIAGMDEHSRHRPEVAEIGETIANVRIAPRVRDVGKEVEARHRDALQSRADPILSWDARKLIRRGECQDVLRGSVQRGVGRVRDPAEDCPPVRRGAVGRKKLEAVDPCVEHDVLAHFRILLRGSRRGEYIPFAPIVGRQLADDRGQQIAAGGRMVNQRREKVKWYPFARHGAVQREQLRL